VRERESEREREIYRERDTKRERERERMVVCVCCDVLMTTCVAGAMGWSRLVGSLKLQVCFAKEPYKRDALLQKRPIILRSLLIVATPYQGMTCRLI